MTGAIAIALANPTDLVKVRLQAEGKLPPGVPRRYAGALDAYYTIVRQVIFLKTNVPIDCFFFLILNSFGIIGRLSSSMDRALP